MVNLVSTTVFVSSVVDGLEAHRGAVVELANRLNVTDGYNFNAIRAEKELPASRYNPMEVCFAGIDQSKICVSILGERYGFIHPKADLSISEMEFDYAKENGKDVLAFILDGPMEDRQKAFKKKVDNIIDGNFRKTVTSLDGLIYECSEALRAWATTKPAEVFAQSFASYSEILLNGILDELPAPVGRDLPPFSVPRIITVPPQPSA